MKIINQNNEQALLLQITAGDQTSFKYLVDQYWKKVYGFALAYTKNPHAAEELTQDVFMDIWNNRDKLSALDSFANFLFIITRNRVFKFVRKKLRETVDTQNVDLTEDLWVPHQQLELQEAYSLILKGIELLPPMRKRVFMMSRMEGLSYDEICQQLNLSRNTVKEHIVKALNALRVFLATHDNPLISFLFLWLASVF